MCIGWAVFIIFSPIHFGFLISLLCTYIIFVFYEDYQWKKKHFNLCSWVDLVSSLVLILYHIFYASFDNLNSFRLQHTFDYLVIFRSKQKFNFLLFPQSNVHGITLFIPVSGLCFATSFTYCNWNFSNLSEWKREKNPRWRQHDEIGKQRQRN